MELDYKKLLLELYNASDADALYQLIVSYGLDGSAYWKPYGGNFNNAGIFENQQSSPENALVEKLTNSIDAILMKGCMIRGTNPKDKTNPKVPQTINAATKMFFNVDNGKWENIVSTERNGIAQNIQIILTGDRKTPNVAIYDNARDKILPISKTHSFLLRVAIKTMSHSFKGNTIWARPVRWYSAVISIVIS